MRRVTAGTQMKEEAVAQDPFKKPGRYRTAEQRDYPGLEKFIGLRSHGVPGVHEMIADLLGRCVEPGTNILDLACGAGALTLRLQQNGYKLTACDLIPDKLQAREGVTFIEADLNEDFASKFDSSFDGIVASEVIEHMENPRHFLREIRKILMPNAPLIVSTPNIDSPFSKAVFARTGHHLWFSDSDYQDSGHISPLSEICLRRALSETGFSIEQICSGGVMSRSRGWWKMKLLARLLSMVSTGERGEILIVVAR
jgi:2-polyprenyl-3-methyl-5-hydroxy-6-metoxy-1,4-benzoquinol methylase